MNTGSKILAGIATAIAALTAPAAHATSCSAGSVTVQSAYFAVDPAKTNILASAVNYSECYGVVTAHNDQPLPAGGLQGNLGYYNDGYLNGAPIKTGSSPTDPFGDGAFLSALYPASDLKGDGSANDPGWIYLGEWKSGTFTPATIGGDSKIVTSSFFSASYANGSSNGTWSFTPDADVVQRAAGVLGKNYFDQFALVFKQSQQFAAYNFTAQQFGVDHPAADPSQILNFSGAFSLNPVFDPDGISHISVWARDPSAFEVPEPGTLALLCAAMAGAAWVRRRKAG